MIYTPFHVSEPNNEGVWETSHLCVKCAVAYLNDEPIVIGDKQKKSDPQVNALDLTHINTPEDLIALITKHQQADPNKPPCPKCGLTLVEFDVKGRFGCPQCYEHFTERMEQLVYPYHHAREHVGKQIKPKKCREDEIKTLKLRMAHAVELERYEEASDIKKLLDELNDFQ